MKRIVSMIMALAMVFSIVGSALAAGSVEPRVLICAACGEPEVEKTVYGAWTTMSTSTCSHTELSGYAHYYQRRTVQSGVFCGCGGGELTYQYRTYCTYLKEALG